MELVDSRRLTGPNVWLPVPGAVIEIHGPDEKVDSFAALYRSALNDTLKALGWKGKKIEVSRHHEGAILAFEADIDALYSATEVADSVFARALQAFDRMDASFGLEPEEVKRLVAMIKEERSPKLLALSHAASKHGVAFLWDDDCASVGMGSLSLSFDVNEIPLPTAIDWTAVQNIPLALVSGTNGKSTTVRLVAKILRGVGKFVGFSSTDYVQIGDRIVERGDYSGPGGGRAVLRNPAVDTAVLEVARGGLLRRGLGVQHATVACVTNIADDHLGEYGVETTDQLARTKLLIAMGLEDGQSLVLNADNEELRRNAPTDRPVIWFSRQDDNRLVLASVALGGTAFIVSDEKIVQLLPEGDLVVVAINDIPMTMSGAAEYNIENALAASAICVQMGVSIQAIAEGLKHFESDAIDNPGRGNRFDIRGAAVLLDFAHNPHGLDAIIGTVSRLDAKRKLILLGQAGDRRDDEIRQLARSAAKLGPDRIVVCEFPDYLRGRDVGEVPAILRQEFIDIGLDPSTIDYANDCIAGTQQALAWCKSGDLALLLAHSDRERVLDLLIEATRH
jgi:cyanophycin synthetase